MVPQGIKRRHCLVLLKNVFACINSENNLHRHRIFLPASSLTVLAACLFADKNIEHIFFFEKKSRALNFLPPLTTPLT